MNLMQDSLMISGLVAYIVFYHKDIRFHDAKVDKRYHMVKIDKFQV